VGGKAFALALFPEIGWFSFYKMSLTYYSGRGMNVPVD